MSYKSKVKPKKMAGGGSVNPRGGRVSFDEALRSFMEQDALRRTGRVGDPRAAGIEDRNREGTLIASLLGPFAPAATLPVALAGGGYEAVKGLGQATGLGKFFPGPFRQSEETSPASAANVLSLLKGFSEQATGQKQQKFQQGGRVPSDNKGGAPIRVPAKLLLQQFAQGGSVLSNPLALSRFGGQGTQAQPVQQQAAQPQNVVGQTVGAIQAIQPNLTGINRVSGQLEAFNPNFQANTQPQMQTAQQLSNFNPLQGAASNTLQGFIQSGNAVDVNPLIQAQQIRAQQGFQDFMGSANEQFGALGLGSSSARQQALAREAGRLQEGISATGLEAGVAAQEAARARQLEAFNPLLAGSGQQLQGLSAAGGLQSNAAGLGLEGQIASGQQRLGALQGAGQLQGQAAGLGLEGQVAQAGQFNQLSGTLVPPTIGVNQQSPVQRIPGSGAGGFSRGASGSRFIGAGGGAQSGGRVDLGDFLGNLTFGQTFTRPDPTSDGFSGGRSSGGFRGPSSEDRNRDARARERAFQQQKELALLPFEQERRERKRQELKASGAAQALAQGLFFSPRAERGQGLESLANTIGAIGVPAAQQGLMQTGRLLGTQGGSPREGMVGAQQQSDRDRAIAQFFLNQGINPMTGQRMNEGGVIDGPSVPPDQVPIMAQGGEGVIPIKPMHELENARTTKELAAVARKIQQIMGMTPPGMHKMPDGSLMSNSAMQRKQRGGKIAHVMGEFKSGALKSSDGKAVTDRKQAIAIALEMAKKMGEPVEKMAGGGQVDPPARSYTKTRLPQDVPIGLRPPSGRSVAQVRGKLGLDALTGLAPEELQDLLSMMKQKLSGVSSAATKMGTMSADFLLEPLFGLMQNDPEAASLLMERGVIPQKFQHGGAIPTSFQRDFSGAEGTFPSGATVSPGSSFQLMGNTSQPAELSMGREIDPTEDARMLFEQARGRSALLRTLALKSPQAALAKMAPFIGQAEAEEASAFENLQLSQTRAAEMQNAELNRQQESQQAQLGRESGERIAGIRAEGQVGAAEARNPNAFLDAVGSAAPGVEASPRMSGASAMGGLAPVAAPEQVTDPIEAALSLGPDNLEEGMRSLISRPDFQPAPELRDVALRSLMQMIESGLSDEEIQGRYPSIFLMAGGQ